MNKNRQNKGITLISLVITIIVLLILAAITLSVILGDDGIMQKAKEAKEKTEAAKDLEDIQLNLGEAFINKWVESNSTQYDDLINEIMSSDVKLKGIEKIEIQSEKVSFHFMVEYNEKLYRTFYEMGNNNQLTATEQLINNLTFMNAEDLKPEYVALAELFTNNEKMQECIYETINELAIIVIPDSQIRAYIRYNSEVYEFSIHIDSQNQKGLITIKHVIPEEPELIAISSGMLCSFGLDKNGHVWQMNNICSVNLNKEYNIEDVTFSKIAAGCLNALMIDSYGKVWGLGNNGGNLFGTEEKAYSVNKTQLVVGFDYIFNSMSDIFKIFKPVICLSDIPSHPFYGLIISDVDISKAQYKNYALAVDNTGKVYYWGNFKEYVQTSEMNSNVIVKKLEIEEIISGNDVPICINTLENSTLNGITITKVSAGYGNSLLLDSNGKVWSFAQNNHYGLGIENCSNMPICVSDVENNPLNGIVITDISAGYNTSMFIDSEKNIWSGGYNCGYSSENVEASQTKYTNFRYIVKKLGEDPMYNPTYASPIPICLTKIESNPLYGIKAQKVSSGYNHSLILDINGKVWGFGEKYGYTKDKVQEIINLPECITNDQTNIIYNKTIKDISAGVYNSGIIDNNLKYYLLGGIYIPQKPE